MLHPMVTHISPLQFTTCPWPHGPCCLSHQYPRLHLPRTPQPSPSWPARAQPLGSTPALTAAATSHPSTPTCLVSCASPLVAPPTLRQAHTPPVAQRQRTAPPLCAILSPLTARAAPTTVLEHRCSSLCRITKSLRHDPLLSNPHHGSIPCIRTLEPQSSNIPPTMALFHSS